MDETTYLIACVIWGVIWGIVTKTINENKGYEGGFWLGFFLSVIGVIIVACKPADTDGRIKAANTEKFYDNGGWVCKNCNRKNDSCVVRCACGTNKPDETERLKEKTEALSKLEIKENKAPVSADELAKYKKLFDDGAITEEEYNDIKKKLLKL